MNVYLNQDGPNAALVHHLQRQGDRVVSEQKEAHLFIPDLTRIPHEWLKQDFEKWQNCRTDFYLTRIFDGEVFGQQWLCGVPLRGLMNSSLGADVETGSVVSFVHPSSELQFAAASGALQPLLKEISYKGFVSWQFDDQARLVNISFGVPSYGMYAMLEGLSQTITSFFMNPLLLKESWSCSVLLTRAPWPYSKQAEEVEIGLITDQVEKHLWLFLEDGRGFDGRVLRTSQTRLAVSTAYSLGGPYGALNDLAYRALPAPWRLEIREKQFRSDLVEVAEEVLNPLLEQNILSLRVPISGTRLKSNHRSTSDNLTPNLPATFKSVEDDLKVEVGKLAADDA